MGGLWKNIWPIAESELKLLGIYFKAGAFLPSTKIYDVCVVARPSFGVQGVQ